MNLKIGSLFSGIGGFETVASWYGVEPVWSSEIEAAPIRITARHFPNMHNYGDISKMHGDQVEPVDIISGGSPCQDLSLAGKQSGISATCQCCGKSYNIKMVGKYCPECGGEIESTRSGLFMDYIRVIREMRESTNECYPKVVLWENVPGALSSNNGDDFYIVLKEFCKLIHERLPESRPPKWEKSGQILGQSASIAWRILDAQYWGVPQRRRRIFLVVDFTGHRASEILFKPEGLRGHHPQGRTPWEEYTGKVGKCIEESNRADEVCGVDGFNGRITGSVTSALRTMCGVASSVNNVMQSVKEDSPLCVATQQTNAEIMIDKCPTLTEANGTSGSNRPYVVVGQGSKNTVFGITSYSSNAFKSDNPNSGIFETDVSKTIDTSGNNPACNQGGNLVVSESAGFLPDQGSKARSLGFEDELSPTLRTGTPPGVVYCIQGNCIDRADTAGCNGKGWTEDVSYTLNTIDRPAVAYSVHENQRSEVLITKDKSMTLSASSGGRPGNGFACALIENPTVFDVNQTDSRYTEATDACQTLKARMGTGGGNTPIVVEPKSVELPLCTVPENTSILYYYGNDCNATYYMTGNGQVDSLALWSVSPTLNCMHEVPIVVKLSDAICLDSWFNTSENIANTLKARDCNEAQIVVVDCRNMSENTVNGTLQAKPGDGYIYNTNNVVRINSIVRRITPLECERLQGFPDNWTDGEADTARYKALGNSVALPCVNYVMSGILDVLDPCE